MIRPLNRIYGGREKEEYEALCNLMKQLGNEANLVFFNEGPVIVDKKEGYLKKKDERYERVIKVCDEVKNRKSLKSIKTLDFMSRSSFFVTEKYGKVYTSFTKECDSEIVKFMNENPNAIGVVGDDSDFLIYQGNFKFFSLRDLKIGSRHKTTDLTTTLEFDRNQLRKVLGLDDRQMIILSTLAGNDIIKYETKIHSDFNILAQEIKREYPSQMSHEEIIQKLANHVTKKAGRTVDKNEIQKSFNFYDTKYEVSKDSDKILEFCKEKNLMTPFVVYTKHPSLITCQYYDFRTEFPNMFNILVVIRRKLAGIVFANEKPKDPPVTVYGKLSHEAKHAVHTFNAIYPENMKIPNFYEILNCEKFPEHNQVRFELLKWIIGVNEINNNDIINSIGKDLFVETLALTHMVKKGILTIKEADLFMISFERMENSTNNSCEAPIQVDPRAFGLVFIFKEIVFTIGEVLVTLGLSDKKNVSFINFFTDEMTQFLFLISTQVFLFDGVEFHKTHHELVNCKNIEKNIRKYRAYVY